MQPQNDQGGEVKAMPAPSYIPLDGGRNVTRGSLMSRHHRPQNANAISYYNRTKRKRDSSSSSSVNGASYGGGGGGGYYGGTAALRNDSPPLMPPLDTFPPWALSGYVYSRGILGLHEEIEDFFKWISPTDEEHLMRLGVVQRIRECINSIWPEALLHVFGSFQTGLYLPTSDIDLVVVGRWESLPLRTLEKALLEKKIANPDSLKVLDKASVPIIKLTDKLSRVRVDISFNMDSGLKSVELVKMYKKRFPPLSKLICVLKQFLLQRDLNEVFTGGLSSYCLILMVVSFLQLNQRRCASSHSGNLGVLLLEFFELYGRTFNYLHSAIRVEGEGGYVSKEAVQANMPPGHRPSLLCIEDPLQPGNDVGKSSYGALQVRQAFDYAYGALNRAAQRMGGQDQRTLLSRIIHVDQATLDYRAWVKETFPVNRDAEDPSFSSDGEMSRPGDRLRRNDASAANLGSSLAFGGGNAVPPTDLSAGEANATSDGLEPLASRLTAIQRAESYERLSRRPPESEDGPTTTDSSRDRSPGGVPTGDDGSHSSSGDGADNTSTTSSSGGDDSPTARPTSPSSTTHLGSAMSISPASSEVGSSISSRMSTISTPPASASPIPRRSLNGTGGANSAGPPHSACSTDFPPLPQTSRPPQNFSSPSSSSSYHGHHHHQGGGGGGKGGRGSSNSWNRKLHKKKSDQPNRADLDTNWRASAVITSSNSSDRSSNHSSGNGERRDRADKDSNWRGHLDGTVEDDLALGQHKQEGGNGRASSNNSLDRRDKKRLQTSGHMAPPSPANSRRSPDSSAASSPRSPTKGGLSCPGNQSSFETKPMSEDEEKPEIKSEAGDINGSSEGGKVGSASLPPLPPGQQHKQQHICDRTTNINNTSTTQQSLLNNGCDQSTFSGSTSVGGGDAAGSSSSSQQQSDPRQRLAAGKSGPGGSVKSSQKARAVPGSTTGRGGNSASAPSVKYRSSSSLQQEPNAKGSATKKSGGKGGKSGSSRNNNANVSDGKMGPTNESSGSLAEDASPLITPSNSGIPPQKKAATNHDSSAARHNVSPSEVTRGKAKKKKKRRERDRGAFLAGNSSSGSGSTSAKSDKENRNGNFNAASHNNHNDDEGGNAESFVTSHRSQASAAANQSVSPRSSRFSCIAGPRKPKR